MRGCIETVVYRNIRAIREDNDLTQAQMAAYLNISQNTYSQYETGKIEWTASTLIQIANYFDVSIDYLLDRTSKKK
ncbi:helix-turn-helix domain-containing protein [Listeria grandensis]|uniref:helix-turn-helix domain-containing protein n=1 Tax=Listeria grandensis TaxID=1494963 RepID=UPI00164DEC64|nr:helix-turn-helix transcriptional regulator [Listeria grandensis]MBC6314042.1 helix-turn-helix transcriptional regulator [Listeria grandensis]